MNSQKILDQIRGLQAETNIKYYNIKDIRRNTKKESLPRGGQIDSETTATPPLVSSSFTSSSLSANADIASLVSLQDGTTSLALAQEVVKENAVLKESSVPDIRYAKISTRKTTKNLVRRKLNFDFIVRDSTAINKITFATTPHAWEWLRDLKRDYELGKLSESDWAWYSKVYEDFKRIKQTNSRATMGKGVWRASTQQKGSKPVKRTDCIFTGDQAAVYIGSWHNNFELEAITSGRAANYYDSHAEYRNTETDYDELSWE